MSSCGSCVICTYKNDEAVATCEMCNTDLKQLVNIFSKVVQDTLNKNNQNNQNNQNKIDHMYNQAYDNIPELFFQVDMLFFECKINGVPVKAFVDTGAQCSVISTECVKRCGLSDCVDSRVKGELKGIGSQQVSGRLWYVDLQIKDHMLPCGFAVLQDLDVDMILGLNMMISNNCVIDLPNKCMRSNDFTIDFIKN